MNEATLRRWVRGELTPERRREVSRWIVQCTDPDLGPLLHGLAIEAAEARADATLLARGGVWGRLVTSWGALLDAGRAELTTGAGASLVLASPPEGAKEPALRLIEQDGRLLAVLVLPVTMADERVTFFLTDDEGRSLILASGGGGRERHAPLPDPLGPRATIWAVLGLSGASEDAASLLATALERPGRAVLALRVREG